jgi:hypothetical protein
LPEHPEAASRHQGKNLNSGILIGGEQLGNDVFLPHSPLQRTHMSSQLFEVGRALEELIEPALDQRFVGFGAGGQREAAGQALKRGGD